MKSKKSKKIVQKTNVKINIGNNPKPVRRRRQTRSKSQPSPSRLPYYQLPMYTVQLGGNQAVNPAVNQGVSKDDLASIIQESNQLNTKKFTDLLTDQSNQISSKITKIEEMKTPEFKIPPEYLKLSDLERFYSTFRSGLPYMIKDLIKAEKPVKKLDELIPPSPADEDLRKKIFGPIETTEISGSSESKDVEPATTVETASLPEDYPEVGTSIPAESGVPFHELELDPLVKEFFDRSKEKSETQIKPVKKSTPKKKQSKKEIANNRIAAAAHARAKKAEYAAARQAAKKEESEITV
ncbi:MAG TPA: hypothetical protein V6C58_25970 [Allocoleopsis sp.]